MGDLNANCPAVKYEAAVRYTKKVGGERRLQSRGSAGAISGSGPRLRPPRELPGGAAGFRVSVQPRCTQGAWFRTKSNPPVGGEAVGNGAVTSHVTDVLLVRPGCHRGVRAPAGMARPPRTCSCCSKSQKCDLNKNTLYIEAGSGKVCSLLT